MKRLQSRQLDVPDDFPGAEFENVEKKVQARFPEHAHARFFGGAWGAVAYRFIAMAQYDESFTNSILENGVSPGPMLRYEQERLLFGFFNSGCSAVDAFFFGMFTLGAMLNPVAFRLRDNSDERDVTPANCCRAYCKAFTGDPIVSALQLATNNRDSDWEKFSAIRNVLTHRAAPPRDFFVGDPSQPDAIMSRVDVDLDKETTSSRRTQVAGVLGKLLAASNSFVQTHC
jgi:hypothetical protein